MICAPRLLGAPLSTTGAIATSHSLHRRSLRHSSGALPSQRLVADARPLWRSHTLAAALAPRLVATTAPPVLRRSFSSAGGPEKPPLQFSGRRPSNSGPNHESAARRSRAPIGWTSVAALLVIGGTIWWWYEKEKSKIMKLRGRSTVGDAALGGRWTLFDAKTGLPVTERDFAGKYQLIYFGFTMCPDVCPAELFKIAAIMEALERRGLADQVVPLFITVDPKRDSLWAIRGYLEEFHPAIRGLAGTPEQLQLMARLFRVYLSSGQLDDSDSDYLVDHSVVMYLVGPDNKFREFYASNSTLDQIIQRVTDHVDPSSLSFWNVMKARLWG